MRTGYGPAVGVAQKQECRNINATQGKAMLKTLLGASLSCITYVRELLPEDNHHNGYLTGTSSSGESRSKYRVMSIKTGHTSEGDRLVDILEKGVYDALEKEYLKTFVLGIYLDDKDPNNLAETYSFGFSYKSPNGGYGSDISLDLELGNMSLGSSTDPRRGIILKDTKAPTLGDVKEQLKKMIKSLQTRMNTLDPLPRRRFVAFKLIYNDDAPDDYQPPYFRHADPDKDRWYLSTHGMKQPPEKFNVGTLETGHQRLSVSVASVVSYLPPVEQDNQVFTGMTFGPPTAPVADELAARHRENEQQQADAARRRVIWDADGLTNDDAEGEIDPDYAASFPLEQPIGIRKGDGSVIPILGDVDVLERDSPMEIDLPPETGGTMQFEGTKESIPLGIHGLNARMAGRELNLEPGQTQQIGDGANLRSRPLMKSQTAFSSNSLPPSEVQMSSGTSMEHRHAHTARDGEVWEDTYEQPDSLQVHDSIHSSKSADGALNCFCGLTKEDCPCVQCDQCKRWLHIWCMGFHSDTDSRIPLTFVCFDCKFSKGMSKQLLNEFPEYSAKVDEFRELALFRRVLKLAEVEDLNKLLNFGRAIGCSRQEAAQFLKRLENEGFIGREATETDPNGIIERCTVTNAKAKGKAGRKAKQRGKPVYAFISASKQTSAYKRYFSEDPERQLFGYGVLKTPESRAADSSQWTERRADDDSLPRGVRIHPADADALNLIDALKNFPPASRAHSARALVDTVIGPPSLTKRKPPTGNPSPPKRKKTKMAVTEGLDMCG